LTLTLVAALLLNAVNGDEPAPHWWLGTGVNGGARIQGGASAMLAPDLELGFAPSESFRLRISGGLTWENTWSTGTTGSWDLLAGADLLFHKWWGHVFAGLGAGALKTGSLWAPLGSARAGFDLTLALPLYVGAGLSYGLAFSDRLGFWHLVELGGRIGVAF